MGFFSKYREIILAVGIAVVMAGIGFAASGGEDPDIVTAEATTSIATTSATTPPDETPNNPDVPPVDCWSVLTTDDVDVALDVWDRPGGPASTFGLEQGETCHEAIDGDDHSFVRLEPGSPSDFESGASILGSVGVVVTDLGDDALWFAGTGADAHAGLLAVREETTLGALHFRFSLGRPELDDDARRQLAVGVAQGMLARFPGVEVEPELIVFDEASPAVTDPSVSGLLLEGVESGRWSMGEGIVEILDWMANATPGVVPDDLSEPSATGVIAAATAFLETAPEDDVEVRALLGRLTPTLEELEQATTPAEALASLTVSLVPIAQEEASNPCDEWALESPCLEKVSLPEDSGLDLGKYSLYAALNENSVWSIEDVEVAKKALVDSAITFEALGDMPPTALVLRPGGTTLYAGYVPGEDCRVYVDEFLAGTNPKELEQILAREIAFCLIGNEFFPQFYANPNPTTWLAYGLANYLSGVVYTTNNLEHKNLPGQLAQSELSTTIEERSWTNWILFEHFHASIGPQGVMAMIGGLPESGDLVGSLATASGVGEMYHDLSRHLSDASVSDLGGGTVPYSPQAWELSLSGPAEVPFTVPRFGVRRLHIKVPPGKYACVESITRGQPRLSWRPGAPGGSGTWSDELPGAFENESVMVVTSVDPEAHFTLDVTAVDDDPDCSDEEDDSAGDGEACDLNAICDPSGFYFKVVPVN